MKGFNWLLIGLMALCSAITPLAGCIGNCIYRDFASVAELEEWLQANDVSEEAPEEYAGRRYHKALEIQEDALKDGFIVSADYDYDADTDTYKIYCVTIINGDIWYWNPETDKLYVDYNLGKVK
jgi:hypothetical protein